MKQGCLLLIVTLCVGCLMGCQRTTPVADRVVEPPARAMPMTDVPPERERSDPYQVKSVKPEFRPAVPDEDKASLMYQAQLDLLRVMICSDEVIRSVEGNIESDYAKQAAIEHFSDIGFRVLEASPCPGFALSNEELAWVAKERDVDLFVMLKVDSKKVDRFGDFYSFEANGRVKVAQISDAELVTSKSTLIRGKRALNEQQAGESALTQCGEELARKVSDEILRKSGRGIMLRRVKIEGIDGARDADYVRVGLIDKPGVRSVTVRSVKDGRAVLWVRVDPSAEDNLAAYLETLDNIHLKVERIDNKGIKSKKTMFGN